MRLEVGVGEATVSNATLVILNPTFPVCILMNTLGQGASWLNHRRKPQIGSYSSGMSIYFFNFRNLPKVETLNI